MTRVALESQPLGCPWLRRVEAQRSSLDVTPALTPQTWRRAWSEPGSFRLAGGDVNKDAGLCQAVQFEPLNTAFQRSGRKTCLESKETPDVGHLPERGRPQGNPRRGTLAGARPPSCLTPTGGRTHSHRLPRVLEAALGAKGAPLCAPSRRLAFCPVRHRHNRPNPKLNASPPLALPQRAPESEAHTGQKQCGWVFFLMSEKAKPLSPSLLLPTRRRATNHSLRWPRVTS